MPSSGAGTQRANGAPGLVPQPIDKNQEAATEQKQPAGKNEEAQAYQKRSECLPASRRSLLVVGELLIHAMDLTHDSEFAA